MSTSRLALALIATAQFVLVLDITIVTVALPTIQLELGFQQAELQWLVTSYALAFGGFLLLAAGAADLFGRRRLFVLGILVFGGASLAAGFSLNKPCCRRPGWPGPRRRHRLAGRARALDDDLPRGPRPQPGLGRVRGGRLGRWRQRSAAGR